MFVYHYLTNLMKMYSTIAFLFEREIVDSLALQDVEMCISFELQQRMQHKWL